MSFCIAFLAAQHSGLDILSMCVLMLLRLSTVHWNEERNRKMGMDNHGRVVGGIAKSKKLISQF